MRFLIVNKTDLANLVVNLLTASLKTTMPFYTRKPIPIEARQLLMDSKNWEELAEWSNGLFTVELTVKHPYAARFFVQTLKGRMEFKPGDYLLKGVLGEFYPCKQESYEIVQEES